MSVLRSILFKKWPYVDRYGAEESDHVIEIHIANTGFDSGLIHIGLDEINTHTREYESSCEGNFSIEQTKEIIVALQKLVDQYEAQQKDSRFNDETPQL